MARIRTQASEEPSHGQDSNPGIWGTQSWPGFEPRHLRNPVLARILTQASEEPIQDHYSNPGISGTQSPVNWHDQDSNPGTSGTQSTVNWILKSLTNEMGYAWSNLKKTCAQPPWDHCRNWITNSIPDSNVHRANTEPIWDQQDPGGPHEL